MIAKKILGVLHKETSGLHKAAYLLASFTFISQLLGLVRDRLLAYTFGAGETLDVYYAAFRIPDLILIFAGSIVSIAILVPLLTDKLHLSKESGKKFIDNIFSFFFVAIIIISAIIFFFVPYLLRIMFPGFDNPETIKELTLLTRILLLSPIFLGLSNLFAGIVHVYRKFFVYALSPILYNLGIIIGIVLIYPVFGVTGLGIGVLLGAVMHFGIQIPVVRRQKLIPKISLSFNWSEIKTIVFTSLPRAFTLSIGNVVIVFLLGFASVLREGSISIFNLSFTLQSVPLALVGVSYSLAAFPMLSKLIIEDKKLEFLSRLETASRHIIFWSLPALTMFIVLRAQIVRAILGTGKFDWIDTRLTAAVLAIFVVSVFAQALTLLFIRGYYAAGKTKRPLIMGIISGAVVVALTFIFHNLFIESNLFLLFMESLLDISGLPGTEVIVLPLAYSSGMIVNLILLFVYLQKDFGKFSKKIWITFKHSVYTSLIAGFVAFTFLDVFDNIFELTTLIGISFQGLFSGLIGVIAGVIILILLGNDEIKYIIPTIKNKFIKTNIQLPETTEL